MIDEKGRLFGKINLVDLIIVLIILGAGLFLGMRFLGPDSAVANTEDIHLTLFCEETANFVADGLEAGVSVWDSGTNVNLGTLESWSTGDSYSYVTDANGEIVQLARDGFCSVVLNLETQGVVGAHGVTIGGTLYGVGHSMTVYAGDCKLYLKVSHIEIAD